MRLLKKPVENYLLIINPMSRMGRGLRRAFWLITRLVIRRADFEAVYTKRPGHAEKVVAEYQGPVDVVVAIGGDGTVQEVINGIMKREKRPVLAVMPAGRGNDFSTLVGVGTSKKRALGYILSPKTRQVDLIRFGSRYASNEVGVGLDASVQERAGRYKYLAVPRYLLVAISMIIKGLPAIPMRIEHAEGVWSGDFLLAVAGHGRKYAKHIRLFPGLQIDGGRMKVGALLPGPRWLTLLILFSAGLALPLARMYAQVVMAESPWVEIEVGRTAKAQSDGDLFFVGQGERLRIELVRHALTVKAK